MKNKRRITIPGTSFIRVTIMCIVMAVIIVSFYWSLSKRLSVRNEGPTNQNELEICLTQDFVSNYPSSPKEVVRWYNRIITLFYSEKLKNSDIEKLCDQLILLMDKELQSDNPRDTYIASVKQEIKQYQERKKSIISHDEGSAEAVKHVTSADGDSLAFVTSYYMTQEANVLNSSYQTYCLRRDGTGKYRILTFAMTDENGKEL